MFLPWNMLIFLRCLIILYKVSLFHLSELHSSSFFYSSNFFFKTYISITLWRNFTIWPHKPQAFPSTSALPWSVQPKIVLSFCAARAHCRLVPSLLPARTPNLFSRTAAQPGSPSRHHRSGLFLPTCRTSHVFCSLVCPCAPHWKPDEPALHGLLQVTDRDAAKDRVSRCPCAVLVMGLQAENTLLPTALWACPASQLS